MAGGCGGYPHPTRGPIATKQMELMHRLVAELGLTPSARSRVETVSRPFDTSDGLLALPSGSTFNARRPSDTFSNAPKPWEFD